MVTKCPKCNMWEEENPCDNCGYEGKNEEFLAKDYKCTFKVRLYVVAFNSEDAKKEMESIKELYGLNSMEHELIEIKEWEASK